MPYQDMVFGGLMKAFPRWHFEKLVQRHEADYRVRRLPSWTQFQTMVFARLSGSRKRGKGLGEDSPARYGRNGGAGIQAITDLDGAALGGKAFQRATDLVVTTEILEVTAQEGVGLLARNAPGDPLLQKIPSLISGSALPNERGTAEGVFHSSRTQ